MQRVDALGESLVALRDAAPSAAAAIDVSHLHLAALRHHLARDPASLPVVVLIGGTGTGKSTIVNRLLLRDLAATSYLRTFTAGLLAVAAPGRSLPPDWCRLPHLPLADDALPARGRGDVVGVVTADASLLQRVVLVDAPDVDGEVPEHPLVAERAFRFADAVLFVVSPEKYQMRELPAFYRLARRYAVPALHVMNKLESPEPARDYEQQLATPAGAPAVFQIARDDVTWQPPADRSLDALRAALREIPDHPAPDRAAGLAARGEDLLGRLNDQVFSPLRTRRRQIDSAIRTLDAMTVNEPGVDVDPMTRDLERRLKERSVLYLMGPGRVIDRVRQVPAALAKLPRTAWDFLRGSSPRVSPADVAPSEAMEIPDFPQILAEQFRVVHARIDDVLRDAGLQLSDADRDAWKLPAEDASRIADDEIADLRRWLEQRWNATPRDTAAVQKILKLIPGAEKLTKLSEAAPYLLAAAAAAHGSLFGYLDVAAVTLFLSVTGIAERWANEVRARTRDTNRRIGRRYSDLAIKQVRRAAEWLQSMAPDEKRLDQSRRLAEQLVAALADDAGGKPA
jgi:hypothetical protein